MSELIGIARFKFHEGKREEYLRLSDQARDIVRTKDSGTDMAMLAASRFVFADECGGERSHV